MSGLTVYSREDCPLCEELLLELHPWARAQGLSLEIRDVDQDPDLKRRYGLKIPVLMLDGERVCYGRMDWDALHEALAARSRSAPGGLL